MKLPACSWSFFACSVPLRTCSVGPQQRLDLGDQVRLLDAGLGLDADRVELPDLVEELLRGRLVEDREGRAADAHVRELGDAGDRNICARAERLDADPVADAGSPRRAAVALSITIWSLPLRPASLRSASSG